MPIVVAFCLIAVAGIGAQWLAWRWKIPAIVLMLVAGLTLGPVAGVLDPQALFGELLDPIVSVAVAIILFEGGLTLNFRRLADAGLAVRRLVLLGGPLVWLLSTLAGHFIGGLSWASAAVFGGILIVTGPTVIIPLLRQASLKHRPAEILRWEAIVNDPLGALAAVLAFEVALVAYESMTIGATLFHLVAGITLAGLAGYVTARLLVAALHRGYVPEYLKASVMIVFVIVTYALPNAYLHESGLLAVTIMGVVIGNSSLASLDEIRRFKENITIMLVSGVFILLAANMDLTTLLALGWRELLFVATVLLAVRPLAVMVSLLGVELPLSEKLIVGWIGPRGVVAVAIAGLFGTRLVDLGIADAAILPPLAFAIVAVTVVFHGFSLEPLSRHFGLRSTAIKGVLIVGASPFSRQLAEAIQATERPVLITDRNWSRLRGVRHHNIPTYYGEVLTEDAEMEIEINRFSTLLALTDNDDYNALVCANYGPDFGHHQVFQLAPDGNGDVSNKNDSAPDSLGGRYFAKQLSFATAEARLREGWGIRRTNLSEDYDLEAYRQDNPKALILGAYTESGDIRMMTADIALSADEDETLLALVPDSSDDDRARRKAARRRGSSGGK
ncbi:MAG TPA: sodium:proton antiporter [Halomonas sp.]|nr:sodium:proton antiporter [Halomonas sp.]